MTKRTVGLTLALLFLAVVTNLFLVWQRPRVAGIVSPVVVRPGQSIGAAISAAQPGTTVLVKAGTYREKLVTARSGTVKAPITLKGEAGAVLVGSGQGRIMEVKHDYWRIEGFEFKEADILLWMQEADSNVITKNFFHQAQGECVRAKYHSSQNVFSNNRVEDCGRGDFVLGGDGKNGEGIYLGTAPEQLDRNPTPESDKTNQNIVRHNTFITNGNECVDIKEGASYNVVEFNDCTGQRDPESGGFDSRGSDNIFRYNKSYANAGAGIRLGGDTARDGIRNSVYGNTLMGNQGYGLKIMRLPQGKICGNTVAGSAFSNAREIAAETCE